MSFDENKKDKPNRRDFLKKAAVIGLGAAAGGTALRTLKKPAATIAPDAAVSVQKCLAKRCR